MRSLGNLGCYLLGLFHMRLNALLLMLVLVAADQLRAAHIIGGEIFYDHLGGNSYLITLDLYRDCAPGLTAFDASVQIRAFTANGQVHATQTIDFNGETIVPVVIPNPCLVAPPNVCVATTRYQATFNLPPTPGGYTISYQRCCRVPAILNLMAPGDQGLTCTVRVPGQPNSVNDSPRFADYPPIVICVGEELVFDHSAIDGDGDSLVYRLCTPLTGGSTFDPAPVPAAPPYTPVPWAAGYSEAFQLDAAPPMSIDPVSGQLSVMPTQQGAYAVGVCVEEYRNGVLLNSSSRDFMFTVVVCDANIAAGISAQGPDAACSGLTQAFDNQSINGQFWAWDFGDPNTLADTSSATSPSWTYSAPGIYTVTLIANPGWPCADTSSAEYEAFLPIDPTFVPPANLCGSSTVELDAIGNISPAAIIAWDFGAAATPTSAVGNPVTAEFSTAGLQTVTVTVQDNGCTESFSAQVGVFPEPEAAMAPQDQFCEGLAFSFVNESTGATNYNWDFGDTGTAADTSLSASPTWTYAQPGTYVVQLVASGPGPCFDTATTLYDVYLNLFPTFEPPAIRCPNELAEFVLQGDFTPDAEVVWDFGSVATTESATGAMATAGFAPVGVHPVTVSVTDNGCSGSYTDSVTVFPFPVADFTSDTRSCVGAVFGFQDLSTAATPLSYNWDLGDGTTTTEVEPQHQYAEPGVYTVTLTVSTESGCIGSDTRVLQDQVEVFPNPVAAFSALPREVSVFDPRITVEDFSVDAVSWEYAVEGNTFLGPDFDYSFLEGGRFEITLRVLSGNGCPDVTTRTVFVSDHIFWAPNAFTPDGDGVNDTWSPTVIGARNYELEIFDRWGNLRFRTEDPKQGWDGEGLPSTVFTYRVRIKEWGADSKEYVGHFSLLR